jgi:hypothetical protein
VVNSREALNVAASVPGGISRLLRLFQWCQASSGPGSRLEFVSAAELGQRGGLASARRAGDDQAPTRGDLAMVELDKRPASGHDLPDHWRMRERKLGVIVPPRLLQAQPLGVRQGLEVGVGGQLRRAGLVVDEPVPALLGS